MLIAYKTMRGYRGGDQGSGPHLSFWKSNVNPSFLRWHWLKFNFGPQMENNWRLVPTWVKKLYPRLKTQSIKMHAEPNEIVLITGKTRN